MFLLLLPLALLAAAPMPADEGDEILDRYFAQQPEQREKLREVAMDADFDAEIPKLDRRGKLRALRHVSKLGRIAYRVLGFEGHPSIKNDVIARYMQAEVDTAIKSPNIGINRDNYKFKYWGKRGEGDWQLHLFELSPRRKEAGLFEGWLWIEDKSGLVVREQGRLVRSPSIFLKRVEFIRDFLIRDGIAWPWKVESNIDTRIVGPTTLHINFGEYQSATDEQFQTLATARTQQVVATPAPDLSSKE